MIVEDEPNQASTAKGASPPIIPHKAPAAGTGSLEAALDREHNPLRKFLKLLGPGLVTGACDDDPSSIGTYAVAGASLGFTTLWLALVTFPLMAAVQFTSAAYAVSQALGWKFGLSRKPGRAKPFYAVIVVASLVGMLINFLGINPISALFWTAVLNGFLAPPLLVLIMLVANSKRAMGQHTNGLWTNVLGWGATVAMFAAAAGLVLTWSQA